MVGTGSGTFTRSPALNASCLTVVCSLALAVPSASTFFLLSTTTPHHTLRLQLKSLHQHLGAALVSVHSRREPPLVAWSLASPRYWLLLAHVSDKGATATTSLCCSCFLTSPHQQHGRQ